MPDMSSIWDEAKRMSLEDLGREDPEYIKGIVNRKLNIEENTMKDLFESYINSKESTAKFIENFVKEDAQVSTSLGHVSDSPNQIIPPTKDKEDSYSDDAKKENIMSEEEKNKMTKKEYYELCKNAQNMFPTDPQRALDFIFSYMKDIKKMDNNEINDIIQESKIKEKEETDPSLKPPKGWWDDMIAKISKEKGVDNPAAVVGRIWSDLSDSKKSEIRGREGKTYGKAEENVGTEKEVQENLFGVVNPQMAMTDPQQFSYRKVGGEKTEEGKEDNTPPMKSRDQKDIIPESKK